MKMWGKKWGGGGTNIPLPPPSKKVGVHMPPLGPPPPPPPPPASYASDIYQANWNNCSQLGFAPKGSPC